MAHPSPETAVGARSSLYAQVRLARLWLPVVIVGVVLVHQLVVLPLGGAGFRFWGQLLFYALLGPIVTFVVLDWIAQALRERERAQQELQRLYRELSDSFALLRGLQRVTERFAAAPDLQAAVAAAVQGARDATGARAAVLVLRQGITSSDGEPSIAGEAPELRDLEAHAREVDRGWASAGPAEGRWRGDGVAVAYPLVWGGRHEGSLHAWFAEDPDAKARETLSILASEFAAAAEAVQARTRDLLTLFEVDRSIRAEGNLARLLDSLLTQMAARVGAEGAGVFLVDEDGFLQLRAAVGRGLSAAATSGVPPVRLGEGVIGRAAAAGEAQVVDRLVELADDGCDPLLRGAGSAVLLPLLAGDGAAAGVPNTIGLVALTHPDADRFDAVNVPFLGLLAGQVTLAVRNADAYLQSEELAIAEERARIAREIHDGVAQSLAFAALKLDLVARILRRDPDKAEEEVRRAKDTIREMIREVRRSIFALRPIDLERFGLVETVRRYAVDFGQQNDVRVELELAPVEGVSVKTEAVLFRIFQEAMHNVAKHAKAVSVRVALRDGEGGAELEVADDGVGFDPREVGDRVTTAGSLGLRQMRERVEGRGGRLEVVSRPGEGTRVHARVPG
ncbi:MAG: histidine kinase [Trueperaceae bacterium]